VTPSLLQREPLANAESKVRNGLDAGYSDAPRPADGRPSAMTLPEGVAIAATPAPTQPFPRRDPPSGTYVGVDVVVVVSGVVVVVAAVVVVSVVVVSVVVVPPSARATAAANAATNKTMLKSVTPRRIRCSLPTPL